MIKDLTIKGIGSYAKSPATLTDLVAVNYFYGANGAGKSTIGRAIHAKMQDAFLPCSAAWHEGRELDSFVYNREFVTRNFRDSSALKGVFTLGEESAEVVVEIERLRGELSRKKYNIAGSQKQLEGEDDTPGKIAKLAQLNAKFRDECWGLKTEYQEHFVHAFAGAKKKQNFMERLIREASNVVGTLCSLDDLKTQAAEVYQESLSVESPISPLNVSRLDELAASEILAKKIVGRDDVDLAPLINKLQHSDWVQQGLHHHAGADGMCPFCQQKAPKDLGEKLAEVFDETYEKNKAVFARVKASYLQEHQALQRSVESILAGKSEFLDASDFESAWQKLGSTVKENLQLLKVKEAELSRGVQLKPLEGDLAALTSLIEDANRAIDERQKLIGSQDDRQRELTTNIWRYLVEVSKQSRKDYESSRKGLSDAIEGLKKFANEARSQVDDLEAKIRRLEASRTGVRATADAINSMLRAFGFHGFELAVSPEGKDYQMLRSDGTPVEETLSEGERSFVTFLCFWHLVSGSNEVSGVNTDRVVVFDDPVSSLDSNVLFIVSTLVRQTCELARKGVSCVKQVFVLTHNVYFHKQVTHRAASKTSFWFVKKQDENSSVERHDKNPVRTSYQMLWDEVRAAGATPNVSLRNTLRRILENYFSLLGGTPLDELHGLFTGTQQQVFSSLIAWVHDGSHSAFEEIHFSGGDSGAETYLEVFEAIFVKTKHEQHYKMMMGEGKQA